MKVVINIGCSQPFIQSVIEWFKKHGVELPKDADESFFNRHDPILVKCVEELPNVLGYLKIIEIKGNIYRINYDFENCCEYVEEPQKEIGWICSNDNSNLVFEKHTDTCSRYRVESKKVCPYCLDDYDKASMSFNPKWCEHCSNYSKSYLTIRESEEYD